MKMKRKEGFFSISAVAKMFSVHQQTIRLYEKQGLLTPKRSAGNTRLFSEEDIDRLEEIIYLTHELGINLAGVEMIFKLKKQITKMQKDMNKIFDNTQKELDKEAEQARATVQQSTHKLLTMKQQNPTTEQIPATLDTPKKSPFVDVNKWEIEYEE